jgi:hypothetical protein
VILDDVELETIPGKHCIWIPALEAKIILSFHGGIDSQAWMRGSKKESIDSFTFNDTCAGFSGPVLHSIKTEYKILELLSKHKLSPQVNGFFYIKNFVSNIFTSGTTCDCQGAYGYYIRNAKHLDPGQYSFDKFKIAIVNL